jgi:SAM-dependent methyltransferase
MHERGRSGGYAEEERIVPGTPHWERHYAEHEQRYAFAASFMPPGARVLDAGCGVGYGAALLADGGAQHVVAVDLSEAAVAIARKHFDRPTLSWIVEDCQVLSTARTHGPFDLIVNLENLEHLPDAAAFLRGACGLLTPAGILVTSVPNRIGCNRIRGLGPHDPSPNPYHVREYTLAEFETLLRPHFGAVSLHAQTYDPIEQMEYEAMLALTWRDPLLRLSRMLRRIAGRPVAAWPDALPPPRWQILDADLDDARVITNIAVCHDPRVGP